MKTNGSNPKENKVQEALALLAAPPVRRPEAAAAARRRYLEAVDRTLAERGADRGKMVIWNRPQRFVFTLALVFVVCLLTGATIVSAAGGALPGDFLYPLKNEVFIFQGRLLQDPIEKMRFHLAVAETRLAEMETLVSNGMPERMSPAASDYQEQIQTAWQALSGVSGAEPYLTEFRQSLLEYRERLGGLVCSLPPERAGPVQAALEQTLTHLPAEIEPPNCSKLPVEGPIPSRPDPSGTPSPTLGVNEPAEQQSGTLPPVDPFSASPTPGGGGNSGQGEMTPTLSPSPTPTSEDDTGGDDEEDEDGQATPEPTDEEGDNQSSQSGSQGNSSTAEPPPDGKN